MTTHTLLAQSYSEYEIIYDKRPEKSFFSIVIPSFNSEKTIHYVLKSLSIQTYSDFEIIVVDDCSSDSTVSLCLEVAHTFQICIVHLISQSGGPATPRNIGILLSRGEYLCFLDSDDSFHPSKLSVIASVLKSTSADMIFHPVLTCHSLGNLCNFSCSSGTIIGIDRRLRIFLSLTFSLLYFGNYFVNSSLTFSKRSLGDLGFLDTSPDLVALEDFDLLLRYSQLNKKTIYVSTVLGKYYINPNTIQNLSRTRRGFRYIALKYRQNIPFITLASSWLYLSALLIALSNSKISSVGSRCFTSMRLILSFCYKLLLFPSFWFLSVIKRVFQ
jgi:glycosyltransferase involved in cell wall biosynthesis